MKLLNNIPEKIYHILKEDAFSLLQEASDLSLHQMYDKIYGEDRVNKLLNLDTSNKKKYAEWVLKTILKKAQGNVNASSWFDVFWDTHIVPLATGYLKNGFQPFSFDGLEYAHRAYDKILKSEKYENVKPVYDDGTIMIYTPQSTQELRELLEIKFKKDPSNFSWCVSWVDGQNYWDKYSQDNEYTIFLIYNKSQNKLYLWNNNPNENPYHTGRLCYEFNNWGNVTCSPTDDAQLTQGAIEFLNNNSSENCTFNDVIEYIDDGGSNQFDIVAEGILGGRYNIVDNDPESVYEHELVLVSCENGEIADSNFCYSRFNIEFNEKNLVLISNSNGGYTVAFFAPNGLLEVVNIDDEEYGAYFSGTIAIACNDGLLIYDTSTDELIDTGIKYLTPSMINFVGTEDNKFIIAMDEDNEFYLIRAKNGEIIFDSMYVFDWKPDRSRNCVLLYLEDSYDYEEDLSYFDEVIVKNNINEPIIEFHFDTEQCYCYIPPQEGDDLEESSFTPYGNIISETVHNLLESYYDDTFDLDTVDQINYSKEFIEPDEDDPDDEGYWEYSITCYDLDGNNCYDEWGLSYDEMEEVIGEENAAYIRDTDVLKGKIYNDAATTINNPDDINEVLAMAKKFFPVSEYIANERGYIMPDGNLLYFGPNKDHISITTLDGMTVGKFISLGNIRVDKGTFELEKPPTYEQRKSLYKLIGSCDEVYVDICKYEGKGQYARTLDSAKFINAEPRIVLNQVERFFNDGIKMTGYILDEAKLKYRKFSHLRKTLLEYYNRKLNRNA